jgi:carboxyl-terminal processing protease
MKKIFTILVFALTAATSNGQAPNLSTRQVKSLTVLGELWGFLKYYHPLVAKGRWNWDSTLIAKVPSFLNANDKTDINDIVGNWLKELGTVDTCKTCYIYVPDSLSYNLDFSWINESTFTKNIIVRLNFIKNNRNFGKAYYVEYDKLYKLLVNFREEPYNEPAYVFPSEEFRLLLLFRYWNIVNYFSPYKYLNGKDWKKVLEEKIPAFFSAKDTLSYQLEYVKLISSLNDGHSNVHGKVMNTLLGRPYPLPFLCMLIDHKFVVSSITNDSLAALLRIRKGDVIKEVNGEDVLKKYERLAPYVLASNEDNRAMSFASMFLFRGADSIFIINKERSGKVYTDTIRLSQKDISPVAKKPWRITANSIGYVNMGVLQKTEVDQMMKELWNTKAIIFDIRNYPKGTWDLIANYLCKRPFVMSKLSYADLDYPGVFLYERPFYGIFNDRPYGGKVVLLVDESSVSHAEYSAMGLQAATHTITIGNTTAGKDGNITYPIWLPGGYFTRFSGLGVCYPDGTITQRKGIKIDIKIRPTIEGLQSGRDEVLERALKYISSGN